MSGLHEVACGACGKRHVMSAARARSQRVLRCDCGQFVRLDRTLTETRSDPAPAPAPHPDLSDAFDDEETHMFSSLEEIAALRPSPSAAAMAARTSVYEEDDSAATRVVSSAVHLPRRSVPPPRASAPVHRQSSPSHSVLPPKADKPLWYVDLGGAETVEMTIEQLIIARRSGKLGEGALVWRAGMPGWRSVGSLIPAAASAPVRQVVPPAAPVRAKEPARANQPPPALGSYERPLATLEFALEKPEPALARAQPAPPPASERAATQASPPRAPTPVPRAPAPNRVASTSRVGPLPAPAPMPSAPRAPTPTPLPAARETPAAPVRAAVMPLLQRASPTPPPTPSSPIHFQYPWRGQRPPWPSIAIAVVVCIAASGSGAFLVRALKLRHQPLSLTPTAVSANVVVVSSVVPSVTEQAAPPAPAASTEIVDIDSLSVERRAPRASRPSAPASPAATPPAANAEKKPGNTGDDGTSPPAAPAIAKKAKSNDLPAAAHSNPYTTGELSDSTPKRPATGSGDEPGF